MDDALRQALAIFADVDNWKAEFVGREHRTYRVTWTGDHLDPWEIAQQALQTPEKQTINQIRETWGMEPIAGGERVCLFTPTGLLFEEELGSFSPPSP